MLATSFLPTELGLNPQQVFAQHCPFQRLLRARRSKLFDAADKTFITKAVIKAAVVKFCLHVLAQVLERVDLRPNRPQEIASRDCVRCQLPVRSQEEQGSAVELRCLIYRQEARERFQQIEPTAQAP